MKKLLESMKTVKHKAEQLEYEEFCLTKNNKLEESWRKKKAASMAWNYWRQLNREYKSLWKAQRKRQSTYNAL